MPLLLLLKSKLIIATRSSADSRPRLDGALPTVIARAIWSRVKEPYR